MKRRLCALGLAVSLAALPRAAKAEDVETSKTLFKAGAAAYTAGDYLAAIQALEAAYRLTPLPAIAFSLAQAERRQFFASRKTTHLTRAIELYRLYLTQVPSGGRRADAVDALGQLEPLALAAPRAPDAEGGAEPSRRESEKTRLMVTSEAPRATVSLDGAGPVPAPLIVEVAPGEHAVSVNAPGFFGSERRVSAIAGALVPLDVTLEERPALVIVEPSGPVDLYVDGSYVGRVQMGARVELAAGAHELVFARKGRRLEQRTLELERGATVRVPVELHWTAQRMTAVSLLAVSGAAMLGGLGFTGLAVDRERAAQDLLDEREAGPWSEAELDAYDDAI
ncbi:MAG TPA: PEGA domain-containing protein, partial [Polyangiaceae bacterium]